MTVWEPQGGPVVQFEMPRPPCLKNRRMVRNGRSQKSGEQHKAIERVQVYGLEALDRLRLRMNPFRDRDIAMRIRHHHRRDVIQVAVWSLGPKPSGPNGRGSDLQNIPGVVCDGLNGILYDDDRQVVLMGLERVA